MGRIDHVAEYEGKFYTKAHRSPKIGDIVFDTITEGVDKILWIEYSAVWLDNSEEENGVRYADEVIVLEEIL